MEHDYKIQIWQIETEIERQETILADDSNPHAHRFAELTLERLRRRLESAQESQAINEKHQREREEAHREMVRGERHALDEELMRRYMESSPGVSRSESRTALPRLRKRSREGRMDEKERQFAA